MGVLVGTEAGLVDLDGGLRSDGTAVVHAARTDDTWLWVDDAGTVRRGDETIARAPPDVRLTCVQPGVTSTWVGADRARLFRVGDGVMDEDDHFDRAPGRSRWHTPWGGPPDVRSMSLGADGVLYVNVHVGGIVRYDNTGPVATIDIEADIHQVAAHPEQEGVVVAAGAVGLAVSQDGHSFEVRTDGLHATYCRAVAVRGDTVLISASRGPNGADTRLYRGSITGGSLERCGGGLPDSFAGNLDTHCLLAADDGMFCANDGKVWRSDDGGGSWSLAAEGLGRISCLL